MAKIGKLFDETPKVVKGGKLTPEELKERRNEQSRAKRARDKAKKAGVPPPAPAPKPPPPPPPPKEEIKLTIEDVAPKAKRTKMTPEEKKARRNEQTRKYRASKKAPTPEPTPEPSPSPTTVVDAPYGYTPSGRIRKKPIKEITQRRETAPSRSVALKKKAEAQKPIDLVKELRGVADVTLFRWAGLDEKRKPYSDSEKEDDINYIASIRGENDTLVYKLRKLIEKQKLIPNFQEYQKIQSQKKEEALRSAKLNKQETQLILDNYIHDVPMPLPLGSAIPVFESKKLTFADGGYTMENDTVNAFKLINDGFTDPNTYVMPFYTDIIYNYYERGVGDGEYLCHNAGFELDPKNTAVKTAVWFPFGFGTGDPVPRTLPRIEIGNEIGMGNHTYTNYPERIFYKSKDPSLWVNYMWQDKDGKTIQRSGSKSVPMIPFYNSFKKMIDADPRVYWFGYGGALLTLLQSWDDDQGLADHYNEDWKKNRGDNWKMSIPEWDNWGGDEEEVTDAMSFFTHRGDGDIFTSASKIAKKKTELETFKTNMKQRLNPTPLKPMKFYESYPTPDKSMQRENPDNDILNEIIVDGQKYYVDSKRNVYALTKESGIHRFIGILKVRTIYSGGREELVLKLGDGSVLPWNTESTHRGDSDIDELSNAYRSFFDEIVRLASKRNIQFCEDKIAMLESSSVVNGKDIMILYIYAHYYLSLETPMKLGDAYKIQKIDDFKALAMVFEFFYATPAFQTIRENIIRTANEMLTKRTPIPKSSAISGEGLYADWHAMPAGEDKDAKAKELFGLVKGGKIPTTPEELKGAVDHGSTHLRPPFCRNGNKYPVKDILIKQFPEHKKYVEPFTGSSALFFNKPKAEQNVLNDLDKRMIQSLRWLKSAPPKDDPEWDKIEFKGKPYVSQYKGDARDNRYSGDRVARARAFFAKVPNSIIEKMAHFKLAGCAGFNGVFANKPSQIYKVSEKPLQRIETYLDLYKEYLKGVTLETKDYANIIKQHDGANTFFFIDPPYENTSSSLGYAEDKGFDFERLRETLEKVKGKFMMTLNDSPNIRKIFQQFKIAGFSAPNPWNTRDDKADRKPRKEVTIRNY